MAGKKDFSDLCAKAGGYGGIRRIKRLFYPTPRHQKKVLALVLAFACAFTMFAGAAFTDSADIKSTDAVNMLTALGVIDGYKDGSFKPDATVTRAEMAKMIFVVRNNSIDDSAYKNNSTKLTDLTNDWYKGYIKFCESQGIIAGKGNNKFDPDAAVTGVEAAKMLLVVTGYDAAKAGLTGKNWSTNTLKYAGAAGILDDVNSGLEQGLPRQYAAQMIYNTLDTNRVKWSEDSKSFDDVLNGGIKETVGKAYMGLSYDVGTLTSIDKDSLTIKLDDSYDSDNYHKISKYDTVSFTKVSEDYTSFLGQKVKVMFKDAKTNNVLGIYSVSDNSVYNTLMKDVELDGSKIKFGGKSYSVDNTKKIATTFIGVDDTTVEDQAIAYFDSTANNNAGKTSLNEVTFVDSDGNGKIDTAIVTEKKAAEVTNVSSDKITFNGKSYKFADENIDEDIAQDDWAVMSANLYEDCKNIVKADVLNTTVESYKQKDSGAKMYHQYELDGTWYNISDAQYTDAGVSTGDTVKAYVVNGVIVKMKADDGKGGFPTNIAVVVGNSGGGSLNGDQARIRFFDGSSKLVTISDNSKVSNPQMGIAYKVSGSDSATKFENLSSQKYNGYLYVGTDKAAAPSSDQINGVKVDDSAAVVLYTSTGRSKQITGKQFNALTNSQIDTNSTAAKAVFTKDKNGLNRVMMASVLVTDINVSGKSSDNYGYITSDGQQNRDGDVTYTIWTTDNKYVKVTEEGSYNYGDRQKGTLIGYSAINSDGVISDVDDIATLAKGDSTVVTGGTSFADNGTVYRGGNESTATKTVAVAGKQLNVTADTKVLFVDSDADDDAVGVDYTYASTEMRKAQKDNDGNYVANVLFQVDETKADDVDLKVLVLDTTGAFKGYKPADTDDTKEEVKGDYTTAYAAVNVDNKSVVTAAASDRNNLSGDVTVQLTVPSYVKGIDTSKITATKNGVNAPVTPVLSGTNVTFTVAGAAATDKIIVTAAKGLVNKVAASGEVTATLVTGMSNPSVEFAGTVTELAAAGAVATFKVTTADLFGSSKEYENGTVKVTFTVSNGTASSYTASSAALSADGEASVTLGTITPDMKGAVKVTVTGVELVKQA